MKILKSRSLWVGVVVIFILLMLLFVNTSEAQNFTHLRPNKSVRKVQQDQKYYSYERIMKNEHKLRKQQARWYVKMSREQRSDTKRKKKLNRKVNRIKQRII